MFQIEDPVFSPAVDLLDRGDTAALGAQLAAHPGLARRRIVLEDAPAYFRNPTFLAFLAENPIRHGRLPSNIVDVAQVILAAGAKDDPASLDQALGLVASGCVPRECGVQIALIDLLCDHHADPDFAMLPTLAHGEFAAAHALICNGAHLDIAVAAALGQASDVRIMLPASSPDERHRALALAAQFGRTEILALLLEAGEDPSRYNPTGIHAHSTPLHQAAGAGHFEVVQLLVTRGARLDLADTLWHGTPEDWANHAGQPAIATWLQARRQGL